MSDDMRKLRSFAASRDRPEPTESATIARSWAIASRWARSLSAAHFLGERALALGFGLEPRLLDRRVAEHQHRPRHFADLVAIGGVPGSTDRSPFASSCMVRVTSTIGRLMLRVKANAISAPSSRPTPPAPRIARCVSAAESEAAA